MQTREIGGGLGLLILGIILGYWISSSISSAPSGSPAFADLSSPPPCNSPEFLQKIQELADKERADDLKSGGITDDVVLHIQSTTTLGLMGNFNSCSLVYDHGNPSNTATYNYLIGRSDAGGIIWRSSDVPPFMFIPEVMMPGEHQYP